MKKDLNNVQHRMELLKILNDIADENISLQEQENHNNRLTPGPPRPQFLRPQERSTYNYGYFETKDQDFTTGPDHENNY